MFLFFNYDVYDTFFINIYNSILKQNQVSKSVSNHFLVGKLVHLVGEHGEHGEHGVFL